MSRARARHRLRRLHRLAPDRGAARRRPRGRRRSTASATTTRRAQKLANLARARDHDRFELHRGRPRDRRSHAALLEGCDVVFHLAAEPGVRSSWGSRFDRFVRNNVEATQRLLEAVRATSSARVVYASSSSIYGESERLPTPEDAPPRPLSPYGVTKLAGEQLCRVYHVNHGARDRGAALLHRLRPAPAPRHGLPPLLRGRRARRRDRAVRRRPPEPRLHLRRRRRRRDPRRRRARPARAAAPTTSAAAAPISLNGALEQLAAIAGRPLDVSRAERESGDVLHTAADVGRARERARLRARHDARRGPARRVRVGARACRSAGRGLAAVGATPSAS